MKQHILAIDQGTTSSRVLIMQLDGQVITHYQKTHEQFFPHKAWVEQDPEEIWKNVLTCCNNAFYQAELSAEDILCIGITNQRETTIVWDRKTGQAIYPAIVWQDRRTAKFCEKLKQAGHEALLSQKTGLLLDPYFSASKLAWILDNVEGGRVRAKAGELAFGTMDCFLLWRLTGGREHATDVTNASRTSLFNIQTMQWDSELCELFNIPMQLLPEVKSSNAHFGITTETMFGAPIAITGIAGDQQAAAIGQGCFTPGSIKSTYGTGCFMLMNVGSEVKHSKNRLLTTVLYGIDDEVHYALEGSIFIAGAGIEWLRDKLGLIESAPETEKMAAGLPDNAGVYFVPALTGLGAPFWQPEARGLIHGLSLDSKKEHIIRAMLEAIGYQTRDLLEAMQKDAGLPIDKIKVDGGMVKNQWLMQWLSDILGVEIYKRSITEITAYGVGLLAALGVGYFKNLTELQQFCETTEIFKPQLSPEEREYYYTTWQLLIKRNTL